MNTKKIQSLIIVVGLITISVMTGILFIAKPHFHKYFVAKSGVKELWYCPMHPSYTSDRVGECPICHMRLVKFEGDSENYLIPGNSTSKKEFTIDQILKMKPGEICLLHKCKHGQCKITMNEEIARAGKCPHCGEDFGILIKKNFPQGYSGVKLTPENQTLIGIKTEPVQIYPLTKTVRAEGMVPMDSPWYITAFVFENDLSVLKQGQELTIELLFKIPLQMKGKIRGISPLNLKNRTSRVRVSLEKALNLARSGEEVQVVMSLELGRALGIPKTALLDAGDRKIVFVSLSQGDFDPREISVGRRGEDFVEVTSGLAAGDQVVTSGNFLIDSESRLKANLQNIANEGHQHGA
ncbi:MAG: hypothetical protein EXS63_03070 [Candidatus Omnitrophica bacterium]|nr:hypothetical protein [Candidatus Omnitrophota bacterium]